MSTRSLICVIEGNMYRGMYCHYDGYPNHVGKILQEFHNSDNAARDLTGGHHIHSLKDDGTIVRFRNGASHTYESIEEVLDDVFDYMYVWQGSSWACYGRNSDPVYKGWEEKKIPGANYSKLL